MDEAMGMTGPVEQPSSGFIRRYDPPERVRAMHDRPKPWGHELYIPQLWQVVREKDLGLGQPYRVMETDDEQTAIQCAVEENERLQDELAARTARGERISTVLGERVAVLLQLAAHCWISAYWIKADSTVTATDQLIRCRKLEMSPPGIIERTCPAGCGNLRGTAAQWDAHQIEHERVKGMGRAGLTEAIELATRSNDIEGLMLYQATWRAEFEEEPPTIS